jgi:SAM-dependent methyltransferase
MTSARSGGVPGVCEVVTFPTLGNDPAMKLSTLAAAARRGRDAFQRVFPAWGPKLRQPVPGGFQPYNFTLPDRYPWLFQFAAARLQDRPQPRILSFGCSRGEEPFTLHSYFPTAQIKGIDVDPDNIAACVERARARDARDMTFTAAANTAGEPAESFDAVFCLAVLCLGDLTTSGARRSDPYLYFDRFEVIVTDFGRCLKPGGLLLLHTANFRFCDTAVARSFDTVLQAKPEQMAPDVVFDRDNRLMSGERYLAVGFQKR